MYKNKRHKLGKAYVGKKEIRAFLESVYFKNARKEISQQEEHMRSLSTHSSSRNK